MGNTRDIKNLPSKLILMICLVLVFVGPIIGAWWFLDSGYAKQILRNNHGVLIEPPIDLRENDSFTEIGMFSLRPGDWAVVYFNQEGCQENCKEALGKLEVVRSLLGMDGPRLHVWSVLGEVPASGDLNSRVDKGFLKTLEVNLLNRLPTIEPILTKEGVIIMDWRSQIMMFYPDFAPAGLKHDLSKLLRASRIR